MRRKDKKKVFSKEKIELINELHKPIRKNFIRRHTILRGIGDLWQADLADLQKYANFNKNYKYILAVIDCFSKFLYVRPLKTKTAHEVTDAFESILKEVNLLSTNNIIHNTTSIRKPIKKRINSSKKIDNDSKKIIRRSERIRERNSRTGFGIINNNIQSQTTTIPKNLQVDQGKEFFNIPFKNLMEKYKINMYNTYTSKKASIVERVLRTLKERLFKYFTLSGKYRWIEILPDIVNEYNNTKHSTIRMKPKDVNKTNEKRLLNTVYNRIKILTAPRKFSIGDIIRLSKEKHIFEKSYTPNYTAELFKVIKALNTNPPTYIIEDLNGRPILGAIYEHEMIKTSQPDLYLVEKVLKHKGNLIFVKWWGLPDDHNSWINKNTIY